MSNQVSNQVNHQVHHKAGNQEGKQVSNHRKHQENHQENHQVSHQVGNQVSSQVNHQDGNRVTNQENRKGLCFSQIHRVAATEYVKWIYNPRILIFFCMLIFIYDYIIVTMQEAAEEMESVCGLFEPFMAISNSQMLILIMPIVFLAMMGDFPKTDGNTMFYIQRTGKKNWLLGQLLFGIYATMTFVGGVFTGSLLMSLAFCRYQNSWSEVVTKYSYYFPDRFMTTMANLLTNRLYNNVTPGEALVYTLLFVCVYLLLLVAIMLTGFCFGKRVMSLMVLCVVIAVGGGIAFTGSSLKWMFPSANALVWMHFDQHMKKQIFPIWGSCLYFILLIVVLFILDVVMINHYDFAKVSDMED